MADENKVEVVFGAETSGLESGTKRVSGDVQEMVNSINAQTASFKAGVTQTQNMTSALAQASATSASGATAITAVAKATVSAGHGTAGFYRELVVLGHEAISGRFSRIPGSLMVMAERSGNLSGIIEGITARLTPMNMAIGVAVVGITAWAVQAEETSRAMADVRVQLTANGTNTLFDPLQIAAYTAALSKLSGIGLKDAREAMDELSSSVHINREDMAQAQAILPNLAAQMGSVQKAAEFLKTGIDDPRAALDKLKPVLEENSPKVLELAESFLKAGDDASATRVIFDYLAQSTTNLHEIGMTPLDRVLQDLKQHWQDMLGRANPAIGIFEAVTSKVMGLVGALSKLDVANGVGIKDALRIENEGAESGGGQSYNMDAAKTEYLRQQNVELSKSLETARSIKDEDNQLLTIDQKIAELSKGRDVANSRGDTADAGTLTSAIQAEEDKKTKIIKTAADERARVQKEADSAQLHEWESTLDDTLNSQKVFGDKAKAQELTYWQAKLAVVKQGTDEYREINSKILALNNEAYEKDIEAAKAAEREKAKAQEDDIAEHKRILDEELADEDKNAKAKEVLWNQYYAWLKGKYGTDTKDLQNATTQMLKLHQQEVAAVQTKWTTFFQSFNSGIMGMLSGTQSWRQSMTSMATQVVETWLKSIEQIVAGWIAKETVQTSATVAGNAARTASDQAASVASGGFSAATAIKTITGDAAKAYAGTYGFLAPEMGPFAAVPAGVAFAAVMAMESLVPSFDVGAWNLPGDTLAMVHKGEMIIPAGPAAAIRGGGLGGDTGGGDTHLHLHGTVIDGRSVKDFFYNNSGHITGAIKKAHRNGGTMGRG